MKTKSITTLSILLIASMLMLACGLMSMPVAVSTDTPAPVVDDVSPQVASQPETVAQPQAQPFDVCARRGKQSRTT